MIDVKNPELLRYVRSELRPARAAVIIGGTLGGALLLALFISANTASPTLHTQPYWQNVYGALLVASSIVLVLWSLLNSSQAVVGERTHKTFDFWRTTRLSPMTLAIGKVFGAPVGAWLQFVTALPVAIVLGRLGGYHIMTILGSFLIVGVCNVALSALALCVSMRAQDSRRATMLMLMLAGAAIPSLSSMRLAYGPGDEIGLSAWTAWNPTGALAAWHQGAVVWVALFGHAAPSLLVTVVLYAVVIAWSFTALVRSIKLEPEQNSLFSPVQVVGISVCTLLYSYAAYRPWGMIRTEHGFEEHGSLSALLAMGVATTLVCLYFTVDSTLLWRDNLRHRMRVSQARQITTRLIWPWLATSFIGLMAAIWALWGYRGQFADQAVPWLGIVGMYLAIAAYAVRDGMFLQWMIAQRVKAPVLKGSVLLAVYYAGSGVLAAVLVGPQHIGQMLRWLVPFSSNPAEPVAQPVWLTLMLLLPPMATAGLIASGIFRRMQRPAVGVPSPVSA
jgi:hypothetical protein